MTADLREYFVRCLSKISLKATILTDKAIDFLQYGGSGLRLFCYLGGEVLASRISQTLSMFWCEVLLNEEKRKCID